jgi:hypothetical protein
MKQKENLSKSNKQNVSDNTNLNDVLVDHEPMLIKSDSDTTESSSSDSDNSGITNRQGYID